MDNSVGDIYDATSVLRERFRRYLADNPGARRLALREALDHLRTYEWSAFVFGGVPRDLMSEGAYPHPRDVDLVVDGVEVDELRSRFGTAVIYQNRFGGLHVRKTYRDPISNSPERWKLDIWPLQQTWAFRQEWNDAVDLINLPRTTFLNVEAIAIELWPKPHHPRRIVEHGFFDAFQRQVVEINYEPNPYPAFCILRSLLTAHKLKFGIGPCLVRYIAEHQGSVTAHDLVQIQRQQYGRVFASESLLERWLDDIAMHERHGRDEPLHLGVPAGQQANLFAGHQLSLWASLKPTEVQSSENWSY